MFEQERINNVVVKIRKCGKQQNFCIDLQLNQSSQIDFSTFCAILKSLKAAEQNDMIFYFDHIGNYYIKINDDQPFVHYNNVVKQNLINIQIETILSDQVLANPIVEQPNDRRNKRNRQKTIEEAFLLVAQWRKLYREGTFDQKGALLKINLDQASEIVNTPRKTLQDYYLLFRKGTAKKFKFKQYRRSKIGTLRTFIKERLKQNEQSKQKFDEKKFFKALGTQLGIANEMEVEQQIFNVLDEGSSDQDILFQN